MSSTVQKPLPAIPQAPGTSPHAVLTDESKAHLSKFIRHILEQEEERVDWQSWRDTWARAIEAVLDELGQRIRDESWLTSLRRRRVWIRSRANRTPTDQEVETDSPIRDKKPSRDENPSDSSHPGDKAPSAQDAARPTSHHAEVDRTPALDQLRQCLLGKKPASTSSVDHLLLCVASFEHHTIPKDKGESHQDPGCTLNPNEFLLPLDEKDSGIVLFGLDEWDGDAFTSGERSFNLIGGTFHFKGIDNFTHFNMLFKVLRLAVFFHHSLVLEQHVLANSNVEMHFTQPAPPPPTVPPVTAPSPPSSFPLETPASRNPRMRNRHSLVPPGILSLVSKTGTLVSRAASIRPTRRRSFNLGPVTAPDKRIPQNLEGSSQFALTSRPDHRAGDSDPPFTAALKHVEQTSEFLSTSIGVSFKPPFLLARLAEKAQNEPTFYLLGDERIGLRSLIGWDSRRGRWRGMAGIPGFIRHQSFSVLHSQDIPIIQPPLPTPPLTDTASSSLHSSPVLQFSAAASKCGLPRWITFQHYSRTTDKPLGEAIVDLCHQAEQPCINPGCQNNKGLHEQRYIHDGLTVTVKVSPCENGKSEEQDELGLWLSCIVCGSRTKRNDMSDGTFLFSFSKFLETLIYSPAICVISPPLCDHTTPTPSTTDGLLPSSRLNIVRHFSYASWVVSFSLSTVDDSFELRVPRLQLIADRTRSKPSEALSNGTPPGASHSHTISEEKKALRKEILSWWQYVSERIDKLESSFSSDFAFGKALPRLPSTFDDLDDPETSGSDAPIPSQPSATGASLSHEGADQKPTEKGQKGKAKAESAKPKELDPTRLLSNLRQTFQGTERVLYAQLARTHVTSLNDVRWSFRSTARVAEKRLSAWENKHLPSEARSQIRETPSITQPDWWENGYHALPGGNVLVREDDWGSIIAYTLSSEAFKTELEKMSSLSSQPSTDTSSPQESPVPVSNSSTMTASRTLKLFGFASRSDPDPDQDDLWQETESFEANISRRKHPREPSSLLSLRDVLRQRSPANGSSASSSLLSNTVDLSAKPSTGISKDMAEGEVTTLPETELVGRVLHDVAALLSDSPPESAVPQDRDTHPTRLESSSAVSEGTIRPDESTPQPTTPPPLPEKGGEPPVEKRPLAQRGPSAQSSAPPSSFTASITSGITSAMRLMRKPSDKKHAHAAGTVILQERLQVETQIDDHPHVNYEWTVGKRLRFSCTVYYAKQFETLRQRCGLDDAFVKSMSRSSNWVAEGGKSKSNFSKTSDDRFIIKTLVNAWNVADLQVLVELGPSYFQYIDSTASNPTVLAKLLGVYTVEIKNLETGTMQSKADILVMENLFYQQNIAKTFDLKGISGRKVKAGSETRANGPPKPKTMFDGDWIESQRRALLLIRPHSKLVLREALRADSDFLAKSNIMDYSLLLGVDEDRRQIACGLVDTIGSYTFAKTLEYKVKSGLPSGKEVTVIPPAEYRERFVNALDRYFLACPDKWSRPPDGDVDHDAMHLPSVL